MSATPVHGVGAVRRASMHAFLAFMAASCTTSGPQPIEYNVANCAYCRMQISDKRFGAELVTKKGRTLTFDSIECLREYYKQASTAKDVAGVWVSDFRHPGTLISANSARFVNLGPGRTPMGRGLAAVASDSDAVALGIAANSVQRWSDLP